MGKLIVTTQTTVDGVMEVGDWFGTGDGYWQTEPGQAARELLHATDAMLLGRESYKGLATVWPTLTDDVGFADRVNAMPKYVASSTLSAPLEWNAELIEGDLATAVNARKAEGMTLVTYGCGVFTRGLLELGLVDELRFTVWPISWGQGEHVFPDGPPVALTLVDTTTFDTGHVQLTYRPA